MIKIILFEKTGKSNHVLTYWCRHCVGGIIVPIGVFLDGEPVVTPIHTLNVVKCAIHDVMCDLIHTTAKPIYVNTDTGEEVDSPYDTIGACFDYGPFYDRVSRKERTGLDGESWCVILPNKRMWLIDSRASNCDMKHDNDHRCWIRHGTPGQPDFTVNKSGHTCGAGAGSILVDDYHGFITNGFLT
jgi:hypothetical protein